MVEVPGTDYFWKAELVLLALGFTGPESGNVIKSLGVKLDNKGNIITDKQYMTSIPGTFAAGDARRGQSLIVWAISEGREAARAVDIYLMGETSLPTKGGGDLSSV